MQTKSITPPETLSAESIAYVRGLAAGRKKAVAYLNRIRHGDEDKLFVEKSRLGWIILDDWIAQITAGKANPGMDTKLKGEIVGFAGAISELIIWIMTARCRVNPD